MITMIYGALRRLPLRPRTRIFRHLSRLGLERRLRKRGGVVYRHDNRVVAVNLTDYVGREMFKHGWYESAYVEFIRTALADPGGMFLDVGANVGNYSLALAPCFAHTLAFEPNPEVFPALKANCQRNPDLAITPCERGLSSQSDTLEFYPGHDGNSGESGFEQAVAATAPLRLTVAPGDRFVPQGQRVAVIKIDVEGHELDVLRGLAQTIRRDAPAVCMEWHTEHMESHGGVAALVDALPDDYRILCPNSRYRMDLRALTPPYRKKYNMIFCMPAARAERLTAAGGQ